MKNWVTLVAFLPFLAPSPAPAALAAPAPCRGMCASDPRPSGFSFETAAAEFGIGTSPKIGQLYGSWIQVGMAELPGFPDASFPDQYDPSGIKNADGSIKGLVFAVMTGSSSKALDSVIITNIGANGASQGPYQVLSLSGGIAFPQWPSSGSAGGAHYDSLCRMVAAGGGELLCEVAFYVNRPSSVPPPWLAYNGRIVYFAAFLMAPPPACTVGSMPFRPCSHKRKKGRPH